MALSSAAGAVAGEDEALWVAVNDEPVEGKGRKIQGPSRLLVWRPDVDANGARLRGIHDRQLGAADWHEQHETQLFDEAQSAPLAGDVARGGGAPELGAAAFDLIEGEAKLIHGLASPNSAGFG